MLMDAKRLWSMGWAIHWLKERSKVPVKAKWTAPTRDSWERVESEYEPGFNLGVKLGLASALEGGGYLANIDVDIKSGDARHRAEALAVLEKNFPGLKKIAPLVKTGYGYRFFCRTSEPLQSGKITASNEETIVLMPTAPVSARQLSAVREGKLTEEQLAKGFRIRPAWEVEFMSAGRQVVLPPSIHPETGKPYSWVREVVRGVQLPRVTVKAREIAGNRPSVATPRAEGAFLFTPVEVDLVSSRLSDGVVDQIVHGIDSDGNSLDRSSACFAACLAMIDAGLTEQEILSVLTDRTYVLGETAYDHRKTDSRHNAAAWVRDYCYARALEKKDASAVFAKAISVSDLELDTLINGGGPTRIQNSFDMSGGGGERDDSSADGGQELAVFDAANRPWQDKLVKTQKGGLQASYMNTYLILTNDVSPKLFLRDTFAIRDTYGVDAPWGEKTGELVNDDSITKVRHWLSEKWHIEPGLSMVHEVASAIALQNGYHPVRDELESLPPWDKRPRIDFWLTRHFGATQDPIGYIGDVFRKLMVASITRTYEPGAKYDDVPILEGVQGAKKSTFVSVLFGEQYFIDHLPKLEDKDASLNLQGIRCVEFGELHSVRKSEVNLIKNFISRLSDKVRPPYGKRMLTLPRQTVFIGTTNDREYLADRTGNRRFYPIHVGDCNIRQLRRDRDQLWAEALEIYRSGTEELWVTGASLEYAKEIQLSKLIMNTSDTMSQAIGEFFMSELARRKTSLAPTAFNFAKFRISDLFVTGRPLDKFPMDSRNMQFAGVAMRDSRLSAMGVHLRQSRINGYSHWCLVASSDEKDESRG